MIRLACLDYAHWNPSWAERARRWLAQRPGLSKSSVFAASAAGDAATVDEMLSLEPSLARSRGGPFGWDALLYACYSRIDDGSSGRSTLDAARRLLEAGADPNAGFLWNGDVPPFTALTAAFGEGEDPRNQPPHPRRDELARLLLEAGADPNDGQTLYNRHFGASDDHLRLLLEYGLGRPCGGPWYRRLGDRLESPERLLVEELWAAARQNLSERVRLLVEHGADVNARGRRDGRTPWEAAVLAGHDEIAGYLAEHGAKETSLSSDDAFGAACVAGRGERARALLASEPMLAERLGKDGRITLMHRAVECGRPEAVRLMAALGFELGAASRHDGVGMSLAATPLHNAAWRGDLEMVRTLVELGSDIAARDATHHGTPRDWAEHNGQTQVAEYLAGLADSNPRIG